MSDLINEVEGALRRWVVEHGLSGVRADLTELRDLMLIVIRNQESIMGIAEDLNNAVTSLATGYAALDASVQAEIVAFTSAAASDPDAAAVKAAALQAISNIGTITSKMALDAAALTARIPAASTVQPPATTTAPDTPVPATVTPPDIAAPPVTAPNASPPNTPPPSATTTA